MAGGGRASTGDSGGAAKPLGAVVLALLFTLAGCGDLGTVGRYGEPLGDQLGWEAGYWHDESISVTGGDGLNDSERRALVARTMARVEVIRRLEFRRRVPVKVVSREEYREQFDVGPQSGSAARRAWNDLVWEAMFLVDERTNATEAFRTVFGAAVVGFYSPRRGEIVIVSDAETPALDRATLAHELVHGLQNQHRHLSLGPGGRTRDARLAGNGLVEGDANFVRDAYESRCGRLWDCLPRPERADGERPPGFNRGVFLTIYAPYVVGPGFVSALRGRGGWDTVNDAYGRFPGSFEQVIHPEKYPDEAPANVTILDRSSAGWERFDLNPRADTVGEASIYAMFRTNGEVDRPNAFNYSHPLSAGWGGDAVIPYRRNGEYGYVWKSVWDSPDDAREFLAGYRGVLREHNAIEVAAGVYVISEGGFADAFRVTRRGDTVVIVNAPTRADLNDVHERPK